MIFGGLLSKVMAGIIAALAIVAALLWWRLDVVTARAATAQESLQVATEANAAGQRAITALGAEMAIRDSLIADWRRRHAKSERLAAASAARMEEIKRENMEIRVYLGSPVPRLVADWLWLPAECGHPDGSGAGAPARLAAGADTCTTQPVPVEHESGWKWCRAVEAALESCNTDKALVRAWADGSVRQQ